MVPISRSIRIDHLQPAYAATISATIAAAAPFTAALTAAALAAAALLAPPPAHAQTLENEELEQTGLGRQPGAGDWNVNLGAGAGLAPAYLGASRYRPRAIPFALIAYRDTFFFGPMGFGYNALHADGWRIGPVLGYEAGRNQDKDPHLGGLGDIQGSITAGAFASYSTGPWRFSGTIRQAVTHTANGLQGLVQFDYRMPLAAHRLFLAVGPDVEFGNGRYSRTWFGVTAAQSAQSGLAQYTPGAGLRDVGLHANLTAPLTQHVVLRAFANLKQLTGEFGDSPIVQDKTQGLLGVGAVYHF